MLNLCPDRDAGWDVGVNLITRSNVYSALPAQLGGECLMLREGGCRCCPRACPALGNAASDLLSRVLPDATDLLFSAQELSRQRCGIFSPAVAARGTYSSQKQVA